VKREDRRQRTEGGNRGTGSQSKGMVDVVAKEVTIRTAKAEGSIFLGPEAFDALQRGECPKGDVLATAKVAAVQAVKSTPALIPMCHPILIEAVNVDFTLDEPGKSVGVTVTVKSTGKTGVEMEALTGAAGACLTIYDMLKYTGKGMTIDQVRLLEKTGGRSGDYRRVD
jgi:cyclic pyranopterin monophosphate synthase